ncbi:PAS domain S-box-containing protein/diguanylate cyclase (GGDEF)-like protein [Rhodobacter sp. JA431]|uniref:PAS domain-containing protein n=1 Tax=Rhodobacter sp. JA431 TaxID=570013 RepID=UPI000BDD5BC2|nr:EAL domain-containing protein [Rhodobacter sp. JA431]SOC08788.1 PAS domain S-box-containing protein/diguanylate cyclase (GGDEF)-like protein [Rhodobacter sp. JA431]
MTIELVPVPPPLAAPLAALAAPRPAIALAFDGEGRLTEVNEMLCARLGHDQAELLLRPLADLFAPSERAQVLEWFASTATDATLTLEGPEDSPSYFLVTLIRLGPGLPGRATLTEQALPLEEVTRLRAEKAQLAAIVSAANLGQWHWNVQTGETIFDERWAEIAGYTLHELYPISIKTWAQLCHPEDLARSEAELKRHFDGETSWYEIEARIRHKSGRWVWIRDLGRVRSWTPDGKPEWMSGVHREIDAWKRRESRLRRAQDLLERAGMLAGLGSWELDLRTNEVSWSDETCRLHGVPLGHAPGLEEAITYYAPEAQPAIRAAVEAGIKDGTPWDLELPLNRADGQRIWVRSVGEVAFEDGAPIRLSGAIQDITRRKEIEAQLAETAASARRARDRLNTLADNAPGALFEHRADPSGTVDLPYFSARLPDLLGVSREEIEADGGAAARNVHPDDIEMLGAEIAQSREKLSPLDVRYRLNHPERGLRWMQLSSIPYAQPDGAVVWHGIVSDVTEKGEMVAALQLAHERLNTIAENVPGALFEYRREPNNRQWFPYFTQKLPELLGVSAEQLKADGKSARMFLPPEDCAKLVERFSASHETLSLVELRFRVVREDQPVRWVHLWASPFAHPDGTMTWFGKAVDITDRLEVEAQAIAAAAEVKQAHARLNAITEIAPVGLFEYHLLLDGETEFSYSSARFSDLVGFERPEIEALGGALLDRVVPEDRAKMNELTAQSASALTPWRMRFRYLHPKRGLIWLNASSTPQRCADGSTIWTGGLYDVTSDVARETELEKAYALAERMRASNEHLALHDGLTGLANRRYFDRHLEERLQAARSEDGPSDCTLIQIDVDHFKYVNDTLGHEAGDQALRRLADVLRATLQTGDFAARLGGDEFSVLLAPGSTVARSEAVVAQLRGALREPFQYRGTMIRITASFGIVRTPDVTGLTEELQLYADAALYRAKAAGRDRVEVFSGNLTKRIHDNRTMVMDLHRALERRELEPWFQPQLCARSGRLTGVEVLVRWRHPHRGLLSAEAFMPLAEHMQIVPDIDAMMMAKSHAILAKWHADGVIVPKIAFNIGADDLQEPEFAAQLAGLDFGPTKVALELRESLCIDADSESLRDNLAALQTAGVSLEIDDFGSGRASLLCLMALRPGALKLDRRIIGPMRDSERAVELVRGIVKMAGALGIDTIAEGVETQKQANHLRAMGCDVLQGYLLSAPLEAEEMARFMKRNSEVPLPV